jgi:hypothetical protein
MRSVMLATSQAQRLATSGPGGGSPLIGRRAAQQLARHELARSIYQPSIFERVLAWLGRLLNGADSAVPGGWFGLVTLAVLAVLVISGVVVWVRPARSRRVPGSGVLPDTRLRAADHRRIAEQRAAAGDFSMAIVERVRAIAAELDERDIVPARAGRTADELASEAGHELPAHRDGLRLATRLFDDIRYGDKEGTRTGYEQVTLTDNEVRTARLGAGGEAQQVLTGLAVPR